MMHQSFLQQLEQFPLATALSSLPPETLASLLPGLSQSDLMALASASGLTMPSTSAPTTSSRKNDDDGALNLSTKKAKSKDKTSSSSASNVSLPPLQDIMALANMPPDTRVPVLNLKDGTRKTGNDAPTLRNLAQWLADNPNYVFDIPSAADSAETTTAEDVSALFICLFYFILLFAA
jgi:hypothetical protein